MQFTVTVRSARVGAIKTIVDAGGANTGLLKVYASGGSPPAASATTSLGTLLATLTAVTITNNSDGTLTISATADSSADATGTPDYVRITNSTDSDRIQLTAGVGSGEASFDSTITANGAVSLTSGTLTDGNA
ncbi:hypothetical protein [Tautonia plasticadhaerens]|uniref:Uncharacterized protein n=1 Tax=Tautonia plasticadhaerens TaxID=2527974 RepID=A0A518GZL2_9BACT|nr:hypothetical protein [Tautonia plasticadhaerens]QDV34020.1 hypothetical protein ElP_19010 [Tautonia plasticadhaerens]